MARRCQTGFCASALRCKHSTAVTLLALLLTRWRGTLCRRFKAVWTTGVAGGRQTHRVAKRRRRWPAAGRTAVSRAGFSTSMELPVATVTNSSRLQCERQSAMVISIQPQRSGAARLQRAWAALPAPPAHSGDSTGNRSHLSTTCHTAAATHTAKTRTTWPGHRPAPAHLQAARVHGNVGGGGAGAGHRGCRAWLHQLRIVAAHLQHADEWVGRQGQRVRVAVQMQTSAAAHPGAAGADRGQPVRSVAQLA